MGSKNKIAKYILPVMLAERKPEMFWVEPFVGGANMIDKVQGKRIGNDSHKYLIALLKSLQKGWIPPTEVNKEMYYDIKQNQDKYDDELVGFVGFLCSFGGKWWGGYAKDNEGRNYAEVGSRALTKQAKNLNGVEFICGSYLDMKIPKNSIIYCDPPYEGTTAYKDTFNHTEFFQWCRDKANEGHVVFVSEYNAPDDFKCVKTVEYKTILDKNSQNSQYKRTERLFRYSDGI
jgi:DNA adenine methylase